MGELKEKFKRLNGRQITRVEIINIMLYATILIMPLIVVNVSVRRYSIGKLMFLYVVGIFLLITIIKDFFKGKKILAKKEYIVVIIFLLSILIVSIISPYRMTAIFGNNVRNEGFLTIFIYLILFFASCEYLKVTEKSLDIILTIGSLHGIYSIFQFYGIDPIQKWILEKITISHSYGLLGNRNFFSAYIILFLILALGRYILKGSSKNLIFSIILFSSLLCSLTRSGWLSVLVVGCLGVFFILKRKECVKRVLIIIVFFIVSTFMLNVTSNGGIFGRIQHTKDEVNLISEESTSSYGNIENINSSINARKEITKIHLKAFLESPFLGTGPDTFNNRLIDDYTEELMEILSKTGEGADKAHNEYLEYASSCGIVTLVSYLILLGMIIYGLIKNIKDDKNKIILLTILGYMIQAFFNISVIGVAPLFWILLGYAVKVIYENKD